MGGGRRKRGDDAGADVDAGCDDAGAGVGVGADAADAADADADDGVMNLVMLNLVNKLLFVASLVYLLLFHENLLQMDYDLF